MYRGLRLSLTFALVVAAPFFGCADTSNFTDNDGGADASKAPPDLKGLTSIRIEPQDAVLELKGDQPVKQAYRAFGKFSGGAEHEITTLVSFGVRDPTVGVFKGAEFVSGTKRGGKTEVEVDSSAGVRATTSVTVVYKRVFVTGSAPADVAKRFEGATDPNVTAPELVYPADGVLIPPNLLELEFQWHAGSVTNRYFELSLKNDGTDIRVYTVCNTVGTGCGFVPSESLWQTIVGSLRGTEAVDVRVRGADEGGTKITESAARKMLVADEDIRGGLYYWNALQGAIIRYDFGKPKQKPTLFYTAQDAKALTCVGCHALSRDGKRMAVGLDIPAPAPLKVLDVASRNELSAGAANFMTFSPDASQIITSDGNSLVVRDSKTLAAIGNDPLVANGTMPDWSADGKTVVFSAAAQALPIPFGRPGIDQGSLMLIAHDPQSGAWSNPTTLVKSSGATENNYYPTFSPDNAFVVFNRSKGGSYDAPDAQLWLVRAKAGSKPVFLANANGAGDLANSWPKFSPFVQKYKGRRLMWVTYSSRRDYGLRLTGEGRAQIWMAAIEPYKDDLNTDPSYPGFWLPVQDIKTGNHIAQWTETVVKKPCVKNEDCPSGEFCESGFCEPTVQ